MCWRTGTQGICSCPTEDSWSEAISGTARWHSSYLLFRVEKGIVTAQRELSERAYAQFRRDQFVLFKKTDAYRALVAQAGSTLKAAQVDDFIFLFAVEEYISTIFDSGTKLPNKRLHPTSAAER